VSDFQPTPDEQELSDRGHDVVDLVGPVIKEAKAGYKTTEFWLTLAGALLINLNAVPLPEKYEGMVTAALVGFYALARGVAKAGVPDLEDAKKV
jgi:hypothetical protein